MKYTICFLGMMVLLLGSCKRDYDEVLPPIPLAGEAGNPRFNLIFDNELSTDIDLHVLTPLGEEIYFGNPSSASGGNLDVDCICACPDENIYFPLDGSAPKGTYTYWANFFNNCTPSATSNFTIRVLEGNRIMAVREGTLTTVNEKSIRWEHVFE